MTQPSALPGWSRHDCGIRPLGSLPRLPACSYHRPRWLRGATAAAGPMVAPRLDGWRWKTRSFCSGPSLDIFRWLVLDTDTGVGLLAEGAGHLLKTGSERMGGEENRVGAQMRAAECAAECAAAALRCAECSRQVSQVPCWFCYLSRLLRNVRTAILYQRNTFGVICLVSSPVNRATSQAWLFNALQSYIASLAH